MRPGNTPSGGMPPRPAAAAAATGPCAIRAAVRVRMSKISKTTAANRASGRSRPSATAVMLVCARDNSVKWRCRVWFARPPVRSDSQPLRDQAAVVEQTSCAGQQPHRADNEEDRGGH